MPGPSRPARPPRSPPGARGRAGRRRVGWPLAPRASRAPL